jgi:FG-GAP-like repeat/Abnormal spindle-like microcephaly-assoc'd, ASPM-SPD-2-Hydin
MKTLPLLVAPIIRVVAIFSLLGVIAVPTQAQVSFFTPPTYTGSGPIFVADFNGDGKPDILASDGTLNLGNGDGTFTTGTPVTGTPLAVADFNGDGKPDVLEQGTGTLVVLLGNGDGTFQLPITTNSGANLSPVIAGDLTGNGRADVLGLFNNNLVVYLSKGDGTFAAGVFYPVGSTGFTDEGITLGDFNNDGKVDVVVSLSGDNVVGQEVVLLGNGNGTFQSGKTSTGVYYPTSVVAGDFNNDGKLDLVIAGQPSCNGSCTPVITSILLGNGDGTFQTPTTIFFNNGTLAAADLNGDGKLDLVLTNGVVQIYLGGGDGTFVNTHSYQPLGGPPQGFAVADFNLDGKLDVAAEGNILLGNGDGTFKGVSGVALPLPSFGPPATAIGDFDKDGTPDVAVLSVNSVNNLYILINDGTGALKLANTYTLQQPGYGIATADLNGDGNLDLIVTGVDPISQNWSYSVLLGKGDGSFQPPVFYQQSVVGEAPTIAIADFNNDHKPDFAVTTTDSVAVLLGKGNGTFSAPAYFFDGGGGSIVSADFNGDGKLDIALGGGAILFGNGDGTFQPAVFPIGTALGTLLTADVNGDGKADLVSTYTAETFLGNGDGTFQAPIPIGQAFPPTVVSLLADINGDGKVDAVGGRQFSAQGEDRGLFLGNGDGTFGPYILLSYVISEDNSTNFVQAADMNGDGKQDLIVTDSYSIFVLINTTVPVAGASFSPTSVTFPSQTVGTNSNPTPVTLTNTGAVALTVKSVSFGGVDAGQFKQTNNCTTVEPLESCTINVSFAPTLAGVSSADLIVTDNAGTGSQQVVVSGTGTAASDFTVGMAKGSSNSATITAGQAASFNLAVTPAGSFSGMVSLSCAITPAVTPAPVCTVPASVNVTPGTAAPVTAKISTSAAGTAGSISSGNFSRGSTLLQWIIVLFASGLLFAGYRRRRPALAIPMIVVAFFGMAACGGGSSTTMTPGTPAGTYTATVAAKAGSLSHNTALTVIVQ